jgi:hypothetical protein
LLTTGSILFSPFFWDQTSWRCRIHTYVVYVYIGEWRFRLDMLSNITYILCLYVGCGCFAAGNGCGTWAGRKK